MGWFKKKTKEQKKEDIILEFEEVKKMLKPYINKILLFYGEPIIIINPVIENNKIIFKFKTKECLKGHHKSMPQIFKYDQESDYSKARYAYLELKDILKKFKEEGYEE